MISEFIHSLEEAMLLFLKTEKKSNHFQNIETKRILMIIWGKITEKIKYVYTLKYEPGNYLPIFENGLLVELLFYLQKHVQEFTSWSNA